ncbi:Uncharacterised protein [Niallia circulans]|jgi:hypothetical protein|nr:Uncharacterised protein [Niallia circulans]
MGSLHSMNKEEFVNFVKMHIRDEDNDLTLED